LLFRLSDFLLSAGIARIGPSLLHNSDFIYFKPNLQSSADFVFFKVSTLNRLPYANNLTGVPFGVTLYPRVKIMTRYQQFDYSEYEN